MEVALLCAALLGLLVFGLGLAVSLTRGSTRTVIGHATDPDDRLHKLVRAHANAAEYAPMLAILILILGSREPGVGLLGTFVAATVCRYLHAAGMVLLGRLDRPNPLRFLGALGTYVTGFVLVGALLVQLA
jgi:hypothetical protein